MEKRVLEINCKKCNQSLNYCQLTEIEKINHDFRDDEELLDVDQFIVSNKMESSFPFLKGIVLNTKSVTLNDHEDSKRFYGCCGPSSMGKLNQVCPSCKSEIGLLVADRWASHYIGIDLSKVFIK